MSHTFQYDWFTGHIPLFERYLSDLRGRASYVLEIGCHEGRSSTWLLENVLTHPDSRLTAIDIYVQPSYWDNVKASGGAGKTELLVKPSREALRGLPLGQYDFVYIDGSHWTIDVLEDAVLAFRLAKVGAILAFDDYLWDDPSYNQEGVPKEAIDAFLHIYARKIKVLEQGYQVWVRKLAD
ncbi:MAG TPA: class I SAM-dependent methyltransferase [Terriglobales bacterium]|jgi:predicted O-methyltransferase YrrM|nr:class I SAM-dependent methyltransferase [Terriglobales bacterium]